MYTFQDWEEQSQRDRVDFVRRVIQQHQSSDVYKIAKRADLYDHQQNETIYNYVKTIFTMTGSPVVDFTASNNRIASNFFHRLNTQRATYLLGNGVSFSKNKTEQIQEGVTVTIDTTKERLGSRFDTDLMNAGYKSLIHGITFGFWNVDRLHVFPVTEFAPLWDEETGALRAGIRYWRLDDEHPMTAIVYEEDGYTKYRGESGSGGMDLKEVEPKHAYKEIVRRSEADGDEVIGEENYGVLPIVPLWGSKLKQSTLVGMQSSIDSFDLIRSGFANDLTDCSQVYWILENVGGMSDAELARFRDRLKINHIAVADTDNSAVKPYTQEIPYLARKEYLNEIRSGLYEDFGALDVHSVEAGATNDHIDAAYQPMDEEADDFEYQVTEFVQQILSLIGIDDVPVFKRNRISNEKEQVEMVMLEAPYLDDETLLSKLPNITVDEIQNILLKRDLTADERFEEDARGAGEEETGEPTQEEENTQE